MKKLNLRNQRNLDKRVRSHNNKKPNNSNRNNLNQRNLDKQVQFRNNKKPNNRNNLNLLLIRSSARNAINNIRQRQLLNNTKRYASNDINDNKKETTQCRP